MGAALAGLHRPSGEGTGIPVSTDRRLFDVIEVPFDDPAAIRVIAEGKTLPNAEAIVTNAVMRRGVESSYFTTRPSEAHEGRASMEVEGGHTSNQLSQ